MAVIDRTPNRPFDLAYEFGHIEDPLAGLFDTNTLPNAMQ